MIMYLYCWYSTVSWI